MLDRDEFDPGRIEAELCQAGKDAVTVAAVTAVAVEERIQPAIRRVPVAPRIVPARRPEQADRREGNRHRVDIRRPDAGEIEAEFRRRAGHALLGVLVADEAFFLRRRDQLAVDVERGGRIVRQRAGESK